MGASIARVPEFAAELVRWTDDLFPGETPGERRLRVAACALSDIGWRDHSDVRAMQSYVRLLGFPFIGLDHAERVFIAAAIHARYGGDPAARALAPALATMRPGWRRRALILGRVMQLGYRLSGSVPKILEQARLHVLADLVRLDVGGDANVPDSEVVADRLRMVALAVGVSRAEVRDVGTDRTALRS